MPTPKKGPRLGGSAAHQRHMIANLATALFEHGRITTTEVRARTLRPVAEKLITKATQGRHPQPAPGAQDHHQQVGRARALHRDRAADGRASGWLHPDHQDRSPQGRQRADGRDRAGAGGLQAGREEAGQEGRAAPAPKAEEKPTEEPTEELSGEIVDEDTETSTGEEVSEQTVAEAAEESLSAKFADLEFGDDVAVALEDGAAPSDAFTIKGNKDSGKYHTPESQWYDQTIAEVWFTTEEAAENAGFVKAG